jgi:hypothetical protein
MIDAIPLLLAPEGYQISRSVRLRSSASAYLNRTPASASNRTTWTWSAWVKRGALGSSVTLFSAPNGSADTTWFDILFDANNKLNVSGFSTFWRVTTQVFRDPSAWYHIVVSVDTTQATANNRIAAYVNGVQITAFDTTNNMAQNALTGVNAASVHYLGRSSASYFDGYLTEINFIDGQALTPSSFGETNPVTGVWQPKKYTGTYGTNGFYLNFSDNSNNTAATIGKDYSGNGNNWTPNNISVTAGATYDSMLDVPTQWADGGNGRGNYAVLNPLDVTLARATISNGNLTASAGGSGLFALASIQVPSSGKYYVEFTVTSSTDINANIQLFLSASNYIVYKRDGVVESNGSTLTTVATYAANDIVAMAINVDSGSIAFLKNGTQVYSGSFAVSGQNIVAYCINTTWNANFGQRPFAYTPPTGFLALNTLNLPTPTILKGNQFFDATTYTGTGANQSITNSGSMQPDFVWLKTRSAIAGHILIDSVRGANAYMSSNATTAEATSTDQFLSFNSNGFTLGANTTGGSTNVNTITYIGWQWKEGPTQGFDIVTYTGNGTGGRTISHSLGVTPKLYILKRRDAGGYNWIVQTTIIDGSLDYLFLNTTAAKGDSGDTPPTSSVFSVSGNADVNANGGTYVAYLFAEVAGFSKFGRYTGNGSADGPFCFTGFLPRFVMTKRTDTTSDWVLIDTARNPSNVVSARLYANSSVAEDSADAPADILSNGFKIRSSNTTSNANGGTYIFAAFSSNPFKNSLAR